MKSKEYAQRYLSAEYENSDNALASIVADMFNEMKSIIDARKIKDDSKIIPIIRDLDQKYRKFATIVNADKNRSHNIKTNGFLLLIGAKMPNILEFYLKSK